MMGKSIPDRGNSMVKAQSWREKWCIFREPYGALELKIWGHHYVIICLMEQIIPETDNF